MRHLQARPPEPALDVEALVRLAAVQDALVAPHLLGDVVERLDDAETQLLALLVLCDGDVLDVADLSEVVDAVRVRLAMFISCRVPNRVPRIHRGIIEAGGDEKGTGQRDTYNFLSTISAPVPTITPLVVSSTTST